MWYAFSQQQCVTRVCGFDVLLDAYQTLAQIVEWFPVILIGDTKTLMWRHCNAGFEQTGVYSALFN